MSNLSKHLNETKQLINEDFDEAKEDRRGQVIDYLKKNPGATITDLGRAIWGRDISTLGRDSTQVITIVRTIASAFKAGAIGRDDSKKPHKYYAKDDSGNLIGVSKTSGTPEIKKTITVAKKSGYSPEALASMSVEDITRQVNHLRQQLSFMPSRSAIAQSMPHRLDIYDDYSSTFEQLYNELKRREQTPTVKPKVKSSKITPEQYLEIFNKEWSSRGSWQGGPKYFDLETGERGPRTDHGGGDDGDGWMSGSQVERLRQPYEKKWMPILKDFQKRLAQRGIKTTEPYVDYGEKGHISLQLSVQ